MYAAKRDGGGCLRIFVPDLPNPYEVPEISGPVNVPNAATAVAPMSAADSEQTAQLRETVQVSTQWPPLGIRMGLGVLMLGVGMFAISTVVRADSGRIVPLDSWLESASLLSAAGLVAIRACRVAVERWAWLLIAAGGGTAGGGPNGFAAWGVGGPGPAGAGPGVFVVFPR